MDPVKILKRAWHILWNYRALWVFGLIIALATASSSGGSGGNNGTQYRFDRSETRQLPLPEDFRQGVEEFGNAIERFFDQGPGHVDFPREQVTAVIWVTVIFVVLMFVLGIIVTIARYISETAVIRMVNEYEDTDTKLSVRDGFRIGWSRTSWRLFLINLIVNLPAILLALILVLTGIGVFFAVENGSLEFTSFSVIAMIGVIFLIIFAVVIVSIALHLLRQFVWRVSALEDAGVGESFRRGWALVRENWKSVGLMWLVMIGLGIVWAIASILLFIITLPIVLVTAAVAFAICVIPALLLVGLFHLFLGNVMAWILGIVFVLPLFFTLAFSPWLVFGSWQAVFTSSVWTLTYREIKALPNGNNGELEKIPAAS